MKKILTLAFVLILMFAAGRALAQSGTDHGMIGASDMDDSTKTNETSKKKVDVPKGDPQTYEVVDVACYVTKGAKGPDNRACAVKCIHEGGELALLDGKGVLFFPVDENFHSIRGVFTDQAGEKVTVFGKVFKTNGINYLVVVDVK